MKDNEQRKEIEINSNNTKTDLPQRKETEENSNNAKTGFLPDTSKQPEDKTHELKCGVCEKHFFLFQILFYMLIYARK